MSTLQNPATYLYLNPDLQAHKLALDVEDATALWNSGDPYARSLPTSLPALPSDFDPLVYLAEMRDVIDVSSMNRVIYQALSNEGRDVATICRQAAYFGTIFRSATLTGTNSFAFDDPSYTISSCNMNVNDLVKINVNSNQENIFGSVSTVDAANGGFTITTPNNTLYTDTSATYVVYGLRIYDVERLSLANLARTYAYAEANKSPSPDASDYVVPTLEKGFDIELYHILYPDTRLMSQTEAYVDYTDNWGAGSYRITKASDLQNIRAPGITYQDLIVDKTLTVGPTWNKLLYVDCPRHVVRVNGPLLGQSINIGTGSLVVDSVQASAGFGALQVTANTLVSSVPSSFQSNVVLSAQLSVGDDASFSSNVVVSGTLEVQQDAVADRLIAWSSIGIGATGNVLSAPESRVYGWSGGRGGNTGTGGGAGGSGVPDPLEVNTLGIGSGPWTFTDTHSSYGTLTLQHPTMGSSSHVFDVSGRVGLNVPGGSDTALDYGFVMNGDIFTTGSVISQSDSRCKTDLMVITSPMERLSQLTGYTYSAVNESNVKRCTGVLAQDVRTVLPEAVYEDADGLMSVAYGNLAGLFVEAMKAMHEEVQDLRRSVSILSMGK